MKNIRWILPLLLLGIFAAGARADVVTCIVIPGSACNQITSPTLGPNTWVTPPDTESVDPAEKILLVFNSAFSGPPGLYTILDASGTVSDIVFVGNVLGHGTVELISDPLPEDLATWTEVTIGCTENAVTGCTFNFQVSVAGDGTYLVTAGSDGDPQFDPAGFGNVGDGLAVQSTPEPNAIYLLGSGLLALLPLRRKLGNLIQA